MDEVDAITPKRETSSRGMEKRIVAQVREPVAAEAFLFRCWRICVAQSAFEDLTRHDLGSLNGCCDATPCSA